MGPGRRPGGVRGNAPICDWTARSQPCIVGFATERFSDKRFSDKRFSDKRFSDKRFSDKRFSDKRFSERSADAGP
jgi:hypothetical protein